MDHEHMTGARCTSFAMAGRLRRSTRLLAGCCALLAIANGSSAVAQAARQVVPGARAPLQVQRQVIQPRAVTQATLAQSELVPRDQIRRMDIPVLQDFTQEAEDWGDRPELGFTVQDMSGWGSEWSGNKQIFWDPTNAHSFKWDFSVAGGKMLIIFLTAAPDYAPLTITLGCYRQVSENYYHLLSQHQMFHPGYATSVRRESVAFPLMTDPQCASADMYRLLFVAKPQEGKTFAGIDSIVVKR